MAQSELRERLTGIHGIGDAKADEILAVVDGGVSDSVREDIASAADYHAHGDHEYAAKFVRRADEALNGDSQ